MKKIFRYMILAGLVVCMGCNDWLNVNPKTESREDVQFATESGFKDALTGVYIQLASADLYGREMTMQFTELLAQHWTTSNMGTDANHYVRTFDFTQSQAEILNAKIWRRYYEAIANLNNLLAQVEAKKDMLSSDNYKLLKGEALGLRGFLHFDILRLWGPKPDGANTSVEAIPYVTEITKDPNLLVTLPYSQVIENILKDLNSAEELLVDDPITRYDIAYLNTPANTNRGELEDEWHYYRQNRFNFYAVKATKARYYLWINNKDEAGKYAMEVIDALNSDENEKFQLAQLSDVMAGDLTFTTEHIFSLHNPLLSTIVDPLFTQNQSLTQDEEKVKNAYESVLHPDDIRYTATYFWERRSFQGIAGEKYLFKKYWQTETANGAFVQLVPVIRLAEMYLIAVECGPRPKRDELFQAFRVARAMDASLDNSLTDEAALYNRLEKEYRKEFYGEGQMFYFYKRRNMTRWTWPDVMDVSAEMYRIPRPEGQIMFE